VSHNQQQHRMAHLGAAAAEEVAALLGS